MIKEMDIIAHFIESGLGGWDIRCNSKDAKIYKKFDNLKVKKTPDSPKDGRNYNVSMIGPFSAEIEASYYKERYHQLLDEYASLQENVAKNVDNIEQALRNVKVNL